MLSALLAKACCNALQLADLDTASLRAHAGRVVRLRAAGSSICLRIGEDGSFTAVHAAVAADATVEVPAPLLAGLQKPVYASGDSELLAACRQTFEQAPAPEAAAERLLGRRAGALAASFLDQAGRLGKDGRRRLLSSLRSWLIDEAALVPAPEEVEQHKSQLEQFARRVEKLRRAGTRRGKQ